MIEQILMGAVGGLAYSLAGLANKDKREKFDWTKMIPTIAIACVVGGIAGYTGQDYGLAANGAMAAGVTVVVEKLWKSVYSKVLTK